MIQKFLLTQQRPYNTDASVRFFHPFKRDRTDISFKYLNWINQGTPITVLRNAYNGSGSGYHSYGFATNYPSSNLYNSLHLYKEVKTDGSFNPGAGAVYVSGISVKLESSLDNPDAEQTYNKFNSIAIQFNKDDLGVFDKVKYVNVSLRNVSGNAIQAKFKFRCQGAYGQDLGNEADEVIDTDFNNITTSKWNKKEGQILIDKELFVHFKQCFINTDINTNASEWDTFTGFNNVWLDIWFESDDPINMEPAEADQSSIRFAISNLTVGRSIDVLVDKGIDFSIDSLSNKTRNNKTGTLFIERNSYFKKTQIKFSLFNDTEILQFIRNLSMGSLSTPIYFFPYCEVSEGKAGSWTYTGNGYNPAYTLTQSDAISLGALNCLYGGLYLMSEPKLSNSQFNIHGTSVDLEEYK
jgi:hypothetical protein